MKKTITITTKTVMGDNKRTIEKKLSLLKKKIQALRNEIMSPKTKKFIKEKKRIEFNEFLHPLAILRPGKHRDGSDLFEETRYYGKALEKRYQGKWLVKQLIRLQLQLIDERFLVYIGSIDIKTDDILGPPRQYVDEDPYYYPYDHPGFQIRITWIPGTNDSLGFQEPFSKLEDLDKGSLSNHGTDSLYLSKKIANSIFLEPEQVLIDFKYRTPESSFKRVGQKRLQVAKKSIKNLGKLSLDRKNYKPATKDWLEIKNSLMDEYIDLIEKFEGTENAESFRNMLEMFNNYKVKLKKEDFKKDPRKA